MKYYFGKVEDRYLDSDDYFQHDGASYYYQVEFGTNSGGLDDFTITDTCGRSIPISTTAIKALLKVLGDLSLATSLLERAQILEQGLTTEKNFVITFE